MRWFAKNLPFVMAACIILIFINMTEAAGEDISDLKRLISSFEDVRIDCQDLAFFLATHNYNAVPRDGYVELNLNGTICRLVPNGEKPGLCDVENSSS